MLRKFKLPILFLVEWVLFFFVLLSVLSYNLVNLVNIVAVDMPWEEPIAIISSTSSFIQSVSLVISLGLVCYLFAKYFTGEGFYTRFKSLVWGVLFAINSIGCIGYLLIWYSYNEFDLQNHDLILLLLIIFISVLLCIKYTSRCIIIHKRT